jgi:hypothetical protein
MASQYEAVGSAKYWFKPVLKGPNRAEETHAILASHRYGWVSALEQG